MQDRPDHLEGLLLMKDSSMFGKPWKERYVMILCEKFQISENEEACDKRIIMKEIDIRQVQVFETRLPKSRKKHVFKMVHDLGEEYYFACESSEILYDWINRIQILIKYWRSKIEQFPTNTDEASLTSSKLPILRSDCYEISVILHNGYKEAIILDESSKFDNLFHEIFKKDGCSNDKSSRLKMKQAELYVINTTGQVSYVSKDEELKKYHKANCQFYIQQYQKKLLVLFFEDNAFLPCPVEIEKRKGKNEKYITAAQILDLKPVLQKCKELRIEQPGVFYQIDNFCLKEGVLESSPFASEDDMLHYFYDKDGQPKPSAGKVIVKEKTLRRPTILDTNEMKRLQMKKLAGLERAKLKDRDLLKQAVDAGRRERMNKSNGVDGNKQKQPICNIYDFVDIHEAMKAEKGGNLYHVEKLSTGQLVFVSSDEEASDDEEYARRCISKIYENNLEDHRKLEDSISFDTSDPETCRPNFHTDDISYDILSSLESSSQSEDSIVSTQQDKSGIACDRMNNSKEDDINYISKSADLPKFHCAPIIDKKRQNKITESKKDESFVNQELNTIQKSEVGMNDIQNDQDSLTNIIGVNDDDISNEIKNTSQFNEFKEFSPDIKDGGESFCVETQSSTDGRKPKFTHDATVSTNIASSVQDLYDRTITGICSASDSNMHGKTTTTTGNGIHCTSSYDPEKIIESEYISKGPRFYSPSSESSEQISYESKVVERCQKCLLLPSDARPVQIKFHGTLKSILNMNSQAGSSLGVEVQQYLCFGDTHVCYKDDDWVFTDDSMDANDIEDSWDEIVDRRKEFHLGTLICIWIPNDKRSRSGKWIIHSNKKSNSVINNSIDIDPEVDQKSNECLEHPTESATVCEPKISRITDDKPDIVTIIQSGYDLESLSSNEEDIDFSLPPRFNTGSKFPKITLPSVNVDSITGKLNNAVKGIVDSVIRQQLGSQNEKEYSPRKNPEAELKEDSLSLQIKQKATQKLNMFARKFSKENLNNHDLLKSDILPTELMIIRENHIMPMKNYISEISKMFHEAESKQLSHKGDDMLNPVLGWYIRSEFCTIIGSFLSVGLKDNYTILKSLFSKATPLTLWSVAKDISLSFKRVEFSRVIKTIEMSRLLIDDNERFRYFICELLNQIDEESTDKLIVTWFQLFPLSMNIEKFYVENSFWRMNYNTVFGLLCEEIVLSLKKLNGWPFKLHVDFEHQYKMVLSANTVGVNKSNVSRNVNEVLYNF